MQINLNTQGENDNTSLEKYWTISTLIHVTITGSYRWNFSAKFSYVSCFHIEDKTYFECCCVLSC